MLKLDLQRFAEADSGTAGQGGAEAGAAEAAGASAQNNPADNADNPAAAANGQAQEVQNGSESIDALNAEIARLKAEAARNKAALDKATHEASEAKKSLKAKMTQEEIDAQAKKEAADKAAQELDELRRQVAKSNTVKSVMGKLGLDEDAAGNLADHLYGAADIENALLEIQKCWQIKESALRKEFGKITGPGAGADSNSPEAQAIRLAADLGKSRNAQNEQAKKAMSAYMR